MMLYYCCKPFEQNWKLNEEAIKQLKTKILKTGFPTELEIARIFQENSWEVEHSTYFIDKDDKKPREIDLITELYFQHRGKKEQYTEITFRFVVEIKNEKDKPWVIFTTKTTGFEKTIYSFASDKVYNNFNKNGLNNSFKNHNLELFERLGRSFTEGFSSGKDKIYSSLCNTIKAFNYSLENTTKDESSDSILTYIEPMIIVNGQLFESYLNQESELLVEKVNHIQFRFNYLSEHYKRRTNGYIINIVTMDYLSEYLKIRNKQFENIYSENKNGLQQNP